MEKASEVKKQQPVEDVSKKSLIAKLTMASRLVKAVAKDGKNDRQGYAFQSEAAIKEAVKSAINTVGIQIIPSYEVTQQYDRQTAKGSTIHFVDVMGQFDITDGNDHIIGKMPGSGQDSGEKAVMKATTAAQKYFYKQLFNISDRDADPDTGDSQPGGGFRHQPAQNVPEPPKTASEQEIKVFKQMAFDFAQKRNTNVKMVLSSIFLMANVPSKPWNAITVDELGLLKIALNKMMG